LPRLRPTLKSYVSLNVVSVRSARGELEVLLDLGALVVEAQAGLDAFGEDASAKRARSLVRPTPDEAPLKEQLYAVRPADVEVVADDLLVSSLTQVSFRARSAIRVCPDARRTPCTPDAAGQVASSGTSGINVGPELKLGLVAALADDNGVCAYKPPPRSRCCRGADPSCARYDWTRPSWKTGACCSDPFRALGSLLAFLVSGGSAYVEIGATDCASRQGKARLRMAPAGALDAILVGGRVAAAPRCQASRLGYS
jgi:hypothetical protein